LGTRETRKLGSGGAGFIGAHVGNELISRNYSVRALDSLVPQVLGEEPKRPGYLSSDVELITADVRDSDAAGICFQHEHLC
jgi:dTDP-L-rhamnose 4-epimerase